MKFNKFVWELYKKSERGRKTLKRFAQLTSKFIGHDNWYAVGEFQYSISGYVQCVVAEEKLKDQKAASRYYRNILVKKGFPIQEKNKRSMIETVFVFPKNERDWYDCVAAVSLGLYKAHPEFFLPYNFQYRFNHVEEIHAEFDIPLPPVPGKSDKLGRCVYYASVNEAWQEFRQRHGLTPAEMCAFLYDFAPQFTTPLDSSDLPSPSKVWLITGGSWDIETVDKAALDTVMRWGGNPAVRRGDILLMYLVRPRSCIHSVWRACSDGFVDPFFTYYSIVWISSCIKTPPVTYSDLSEHRLLSRNSAVRAHFQGPSSKAPFSVEEYEAILEIMKNKGQNISLLPRLPVSDYLLSVELLNERDIEVHLIEPFLKRLGFKESDWVRQMPVKMGRGERNYPDYAVGAKTKRGEESAKMVLESKYQLSAHREFTEAFYQTKSYALRLQSKIMAMAAREGIWVFPPDNGNFDIKKFVYKSWGELNHPDHRHKILQLIGRDKVWGKT